MSDVCNVPRPDITALAEGIKSEISARVLNGAPVIPLSTEDVLAYVFAGASFEVASIGNIMLAESDPETQCCDTLVKWAGRRGIYMLSSERSKGFVTLTGSAGTPIPSNLFLNHNTNSYDLDPTYNNPSEIPLSGTAIIRVVSQQPGAAFNVPAGSVMVTGTVVPNINSDAITTSGIVGGTDAEDCESLRKRIVEMRRLGVVSVNADWFVQETLKYPGVTKACIDRCNCCDSGWVVIYPFFGQMFPPYGVPNSDILDDMTKVMFGVNNGSGEGKAPIGIKGFYSCATPTAVNIVVSGVGVIGSVQQQAIREALDVWYLNNLCPGSVICKDDLWDIIKPLLPNSCKSDITFSIDPIAASQDEAHLTFQCGYFPVAGSISGA